MITEQITIDPIIHATGLPADVELCGKRWLETGNPFPACIVCNGSRVVPSIGECPECSTPPPKP